MSTASIFHASVDSQSIVVKAHFLSVTYVLGRVHAKTSSVLVMEPTSSLTISHRTRLFVVVSYINFVRLYKANHIISEEACYQPIRYVAFTLSNDCTDFLDNCKNGQAKIYCCDTDIATGFCYWNEGTAQDDSTCVNSDHCRDQTDTLVVQDYNGGFDITANYHTCSVLGSVPYTRGGQRSITKALLAFCCPADVTGTVSQISSRLA
jgi:hypothetical protein